MAEPGSLLSVSAASGAYRASRGMESIASPTEVAAPSFSDMLADAGRDTVASMRAAEATAMSGLRDGSDTQAVVEATLELESTVQTAVSIRDKLVEAYQEIMRMPV
ncbi:hypothetical protein GCM10011415_13220 [Salipiger pallidus]|uniref:Flagellar hook-basal body complex protein FliE n=1 Tax=Salipiger pallidus TaxID=1775170 RepID=A0A8J3EF36_9RHOB|nr:flagellar hook-basal body complex protein FliE [Salipiger pallidus]GGG67542.1 hypothetical protein GCM10011415_13220 [Salipiger pallidus]